MTVRSHLDAEIAATKTAAARRLARLREKQCRDRERLDARVLCLLRVRLRPQDLAAVEAEARAQLDAETAERSRRAREAGHSRKASADIDATVVDAAHAQQGAAS